MELTLWCDSPSSLLLGAGDSVQVTPFLLFETQRGVFRCEARSPDAVHWTVADTAIAHVGAHGWIRAAAPGQAVVAATAARGLYARREVHVLPAIDHLAWAPTQARITVGDTVRLIPAAFDATGCVLTRLSPRELTYDGDENAELVQWSDSAGLLVRGVRPGRFLIIARVAQRADTVVVTIAAREGLVREPR